MASGYKVNGVDLDDIFEQRDEEVPVPTTGYAVWGVDICYRFRPSEGSEDRIDYDTGYKVNGTDLSQLFAAKVAVSAPTITSHPSNVTKTEGEDATFTITATGATSYQWQRYNGSTWDNISGATSSSLTIEDVEESDEGSYRCVATNSIGSTPSNSATLTVNSSGGSAPTITSHPSNATEEEGEDATFSISATGADSYRWQKNGSNLSNSSKYSGVTTTTLTVHDVEESDEGSYRCVASNGSGDTPSNSATLTVTEAPPTLVVTSHPSDERVGVGQSASFSVSVSGGTGSYSYQWYRQLDHDGSIEQLTAKTAATMTISSTVFLDQGEYWCAITSGSQTVQSDRAVLDTVSAPVIAIQPSNQTVDPGEDAVFSCTATAESGTGITFTQQWYKDGSPLSNSSKYSGVNTNTLTVHDAEESDEGDYYFQVSNNFGGVATTNTVTLTVTGFSNTPPVITEIGVSPSSGPIGTTVTITFKATDSDGNMNAWTVRHVGFGAINPGGAGAAPNSGSTLNKSFSYEIPSGVGSVEEFRFEVGDSAGGSDGPESTYFTVTP